MLYLVPRVVSLFPSSQIVIFYKLLSSSVQLQNGNISRIGKRVDRLFSKHFVRNVYLVFQKWTERKQIISLSFVKGEIDKHPTCAGITAATR